MTLTRMSCRTGLWLLLLVVAASACGHPTRQQRQASGEKRTDEATVLLHQAEQHLRELDAEGAEPLLAQAREVLSHPDVSLSPEAEMLRSELAECHAQLPRVREERVRRAHASTTQRESQEREALARRERQELETSVEKQRDAVVEAMSAVTQTLEALEGPQAGEAQVVAAREALQQTRERLRTGQPLEARSEDYAASARSTERRLEQAEARLRRAQRVIDFVSGPLQESQEVPTLEKQARRERDLETRLSLYTDFQERYRRCGTEARSLLAERPELARHPLPLPGRRPLVLKAVATRCQQQAGLVQRVVLKLEKARAKQQKLVASRDTARQKALARKRH